MKKGLLISVVLLLNQICAGQSARVVLVKHELRWTSETFFPDYFHETELRDSIFNDTRQELMKFPGMENISFPADVEYKVIEGFGKLKTEMPVDTTYQGVAIGIFSFITRGTSSYEIFWKMNILIKEKGKADIIRSASHELEYYDASGYFTPRRWLSAEQFRSIFGRLVKEAMGSSSPSNEKIIIGYPVEKENLIRSLFPGSQRCLLKINGAWRNGSNFAALLEAGSDTLVRLDYHSGWETEFARPTGSAVFASLFTAVTGIDVSYEQKVTMQKKGTIKHPDGRKNKIRLNWIEMQERTVRESDCTSRITEPLVIELYNAEKQVGSFIFTRREVLHATVRTKEKFSILTGASVQNTLGSEQTCRIDGYYNEKPVFAEINDYHGIIEVSVDSVLLAMMVEQNVNPDCHTFSESKLTKKGLVASSMTNVGKLSLDDPEKTEWYPVYLPSGVSAGTREMCLEILSCLFAAL